MSPRRPPREIRIFHITHIRNLPGILEAGCLWSDLRLKESQPEVIIGFDHIKQRRLERIGVTCHSGTKVGEYVPFYFCPRSVMLFVIYRRHHDLAYRGGQPDILHLVSTVETAVELAGDRPWAYSDGNASAGYTGFYNQLERIDDFVNWQAVRATNWSDPAIKEKKQAEFLVYDFLPWEAIEEIGVFDSEVADRVTRILEGAAHRPEIRVRRDWYY